MKQPLFVMLLSLFAVSPAMAEGPLVGEPEQPRQPSIYHVSPDGNDENPGTPDKPWKTLDRVNKGFYRAGDQILFQAGKEFSGTLHLHPENVQNTAEEAPIIIGSFGDGQATLEGDKKNGIYIHNTPAIRITGLKLRGKAEGCDAKGFGGAHGIYLNADLAEPRAIAIENVEISGYCLGITLSAHDRGHFRNIRISSVHVHDNKAGGIALLGGEPQHPWGYMLKEVVVENSHIHDNPGVPRYDTGNNLTGSGIFVRDAENVVIRGNRVHDNGGKNACVDDGGNEGRGAFAVWAAGTQITLEQNEVHGQKVAPECPWDGGALSVFGSDSFIQYNYSHGNDGIAFALDNPPSARRNVVRYNISENDGRKANNQGMIMVAGGLGPFEIYHNTIYARRDSGSAGPAVYVASGDSGGKMFNVRFRNNIFDSDNEGPLVMAADPSLIEGLRFEGNAYFDPDGRYEILWGPAVYNGIEEWSKEALQETREERTSAVVRDPEFCRPGSGGNIEGKSSALSAYRLRPGSPAVDAALSLEVDTGTRDFYGNAYPAGAAGDIGAHEFQAGETCEF
jgi:hypothetical protein